MLFRSYLERLIAQMLDERGHWLRFVAGEKPQALCERVNASLAHLAHARLEALCALIPAGLRRRAQALPGCGSLGAQPADLRHWKRFAHLALTKDDWRRQLSAHRLGDDFADARHCRELRDLIGELQRLAGVREALLALRKAAPAELDGDDASAIQALSRDRKSVV